MAQLALPLTVKGARDDTAIIIGSANAAAARALDRPQDWPFGTAILSGPRRSGKSMLGRWFVESRGGIVVDNADRLADDDLFHRWNSAQERGHPLLFIVGDQEWIIQLPDLRSRLSSALRAVIGVPDDAMAADLIFAHAAQRGLALGADAATYLVPRIERSYAAIEQLVGIIDRLSLERKSPATQSLWRSAIAIMDGGTGAEDPDGDQGRLI